MFVFSWQAYFTNCDPSPQSLVENIRSISDQIWQSVDSAQQESLQSDVNNLAESVKNCLTAAADRQAQLEKDARSYKEYEDLLEQMKQLILNKSQMNEETATNIPALKTLIASLESRSASLQVNLNQCSFIQIWSEFNILLCDRRSNRLWKRSRIKRRKWKNELTWPVARRLTKDVRPWRNNGVTFKTGWWSGVASSMTLSIPGR